MIFIPNDKIFSLKWFRDYSMIVIGSFILAVGFVYFISPHRIVPGGVYGIAIIVHYMTQGMFSFWPEGIPIGLLGLVLNIPLTMIGIKILGPRFGIKTIVWICSFIGFYGPDYLLAGGWGCTARS